MAYNTISNKPVDQTQPVTQPVQTQAAVQTAQPTTPAVTPQQTSTPVQQTQTNSAYSNASNAYANALQGAQEGSGGVAANGFTGTTTATTPDGQTISVSYLNGVMQNQGGVPDGTVVHAQNGQNYVYHKPLSGAAGGAPSVSPIRNRAPDLTGELDRWLSAAQQQATLQSDYAVSQGVNELTRAEQDAQEQFETQRNQVAAAEQKALDNQALYNERRGDRGGIGAAQYGAIQNTAAQNILAVNQAQTKLSTDTARQIADLRAQGEFQKADSLLQLTQTYLSQLMSLKQWAAEFNLSVDQFNKQLEQWNLEFEADVASLTGNYRGTPTMAQRQMDANYTGYYNGAPTLEYQQTLAQAGMTLAQMGIEPSESQLAAMAQVYGYDAGTISSIVSSARLSAQTGGGGGGGGKPTSTTPKTVNLNDNTLKLAAQQYENGNARSAVNTLKAYYRDAALVKQALETFMDADEVAEYTAELNRELGGGNYSNRTGGLNFQSEMQAVATLFDQGLDEQAVSRVQRMLPYLSSEQVDQINALAAKYGK